MPYRTVRPGVIQIGGNFVGGLSTEPLYEYQPLPDSELIKELPERTWWQRCDPDRRSLIIQVGIIL